MLKELFCVSPLVKLITHFLVVSTQQYDVCQEEEDDGGVSTKMEGSVDRMAATSIDST